MDCKVAEWFLQMNSSLCLTKELCITRNLGARWAPISSWWPSATLLALPACLTSSFTTLGHSSRVLLHVKGGGYPGRHRADSERISMKLGYIVYIIYPYVWWYNIGAPRAGARRIVGSGVRAGKQILGAA